jgi:hypothetical protein
VIQHSITVFARRGKCCSTPFLQAHPTVWAIYTLEHTGLTRLLSGLPVGLQEATPDRSATSPAVDQTKLSGGPVALGAHFCAAIGWKTAQSRPHTASSKKAEERPQSVVCSSSCVLRTAGSTRSSAGTVATSYTQYG